MAEKIFLQWNPSSSIVLPKDAIIFKKVLEGCHISVGHAGRSVSLNKQLRNSGFRLICRSSVTRSVINKCVLCRSLRGKFTIQKIAELSEQRVTDSSPFTYWSGYFWSIYYNRNWKELIYSDMVQFLHALQASQTQQRQIHCKIWQCQKFNIRQWHKLCGCQ